LKIPSYIISFLFEEPHLMGGLVVTKVTEIGSPQKLEYFPIGPLHTGMTFLGFNFLTY
jgi:hypothetical protein